MLGLQVRAAGHVWGSVSATVHAASLALHDERPGRGRGPVLGNHAPVPASETRASPSNALILVNDAWTWERPRPGAHPGWEDGGVPDGGTAPAWQRVRGAIAAGEAPFAQPPARLARHSSFKWGAFESPAADPTWTLRDLHAPHRPEHSRNRVVPGSKQAGALTSRPDMPFEHIPSPITVSSHAPPGVYGDMPGISRTGSEAGDLGRGPSGVAAERAGGAGGAARADAGPQEDGFLLEYVLQNAALGPSRGPQVCHIP